MGWRNRPWITTAQHWKLTFYSLVIRRVPLVEQELLNVSGTSEFILSFQWVSCCSKSQVFYVVFIDRSLSSFICGHGIVCLSICNRIGGVMVSVLISSAVDRRFECRLGQTKDYKILNRNESGRFGASKSDSTYHFFGNACTKSG